MKQTQQKRFLVAGLVLLGLIASAAGEGPRWASWRGPGDLGSSAQGEYPAKLDGDTLVWKIELPGKGCSTPIVWDGQIFITSPDGNQDAVIAYSWEGKEQWRTKLGGAKQGKHQNGSSCNPSPVTDGEYLFAYFKSGTLAALDLQGKELWKTNLVEEFGGYQLYWDLGNSPVITDAHVVVAVMHGGKSFLIAYDKKSGKVAWQSERNYKTPVEGDQSYATPHVIGGAAGQQTIVSWGAEHVTAHNAADGALLWQADGFNPDSKPNWVVVGSSAIAGDVVVVPYGRGSHVAGIKLGGEGGPSENRRLWTRDDTGCFVPTPAVHGGRIYLLGDSGKIDCLDPQTGKSHWSENLPRGSAKYYSSPTIAGGKLYAAREDGVLFVAEIGDGLKLVSENDFGERLIAAPVPVGDRLLIRGEKHLSCFAVGAGK